MTNGIIDADYYINPIPAGLVLTGIVVSVSVTAFSLALVLRLYSIMARWIWMNPENDERGGRGIIWNIM